MALVHCLILAHCESEFDTHAIELRSEIENGIKEPHLIKI